MKDTAQLAAFRLPEQRMGLSVKEKKGNRSSTSDVHATTLLY